MAVIAPRNGASLAQVVQAALNVAGRAGVSIETGGRGNGVRVPDAHLSAIEAELGWTDAEQPTASVPDEDPTQPPTQVATQPPTPVADETPAPADETEPDQAPAKKAAPAHKTTSSSRRARRGKEG